ncbi:MAG TPA: cytochrome b/b6 domain-containing protein [Devosia sp.]|jgi:cytochrome b561|nr:cytochrome b/b6 domain-containing protein [Devosia sp.]
MSDAETEAGRRAVRIEFYDAPTLVFHWWTAALVVLLFATSLIWNYVTPHNRFWRPLLETSHVSLGVLFALLIIVRVIWRLTGMRRLPPEAGIAGLLSQIMYGLLYVLLVAETVTGFVLRWAQGEEFTFFGLFSIPALMAKDRGMAEQLEQWHNYIGWAIVILALGHAAAALVHHYVLKDQVLERMLVRRARQSA